MAFIPVPFTVEVCISFAGALKPQKVCFNVTSAVTWTLTAAQQLASDIIDAIFTDGMGWLATQTAIESLHVTDISSASGFSFDQITGSGTNILPLTPVSSGPQGSVQAALVTTLRTPNRGRSFRGRNYWPGIKQADIDSDGSTVSNTRATAQQNFTNALITKIHSNPQRQLVVVSRHAGGGPRTTGITTPVSAIDTNTHIDTQRRRITP